MNLDEEEFIRSVEVYGKTGLGIRVSIIVCYIQGVTGGTDQTSGGCSLC